MKHNHQLEVKPNVYSNEKHLQDSEISDLCKNSEYTISATNLLDPENLSADLISLSDCEYSSQKATQFNLETLSDKKTPNFNTKVQSKISLLLLNQGGVPIVLPENAAKISNRPEGNMLNMSLDDIPEELEEGNTTSDNLRSNYSSHIDRLLNYASNSNSKTSKQESKLCEYDSGKYSSNEAKN